MSGTAANTPGVGTFRHDRDAALDRVGLLRVGVLPEFQRLTRIASQLMQTPVSLVSFVGSDRQVFKGRHGEFPQEFQAETPLSHSFCQHVVDSGEPLLIRDARRDPRVNENLAIDDLGVVAYAGWPVVDPDGVVLGSMCAIDDRPRDWSDEQVDLLGELAAIASAEIALRVTTTRAERARRDAEAALVREQALSRLLQRSLLPQVDLSLPSVEIGSYYRPAAGIIGGDFIDSFAAGPNTAGLAVGDIVGKGLQAAARALELRGEMRRLAIRNPQPAAVLAGLNALAKHKPGLFCASMLYGLADLEHATFTWVSAGHPPPVIRSANGVSVLPSTGGTLIGVDPPGQSWTEHLTALQPGCTVVMFTDGLIEIPHDALDARSAKLQHVIADGPEDPEQLCPHIAAEMMTDHAQLDDVAILALRAGSAHS